MSIALAGASLVSFGYSGCLLGQRPVSDEVVLQPRSPVAFFEFPPELSAGPDYPRPGSIQDLAFPGGRVTINASFYTESTGTLVANWFVDRRRSTVCDPLANCGGPRQLTPQPLGANVRSTQFTWTAPQGPGCHVIDLYVSSAFQPEPERAHLPLLSGDVSHARWFVVVRDASNGLPSIGDCTVWN